MVPLDLQAPQPVTERVPPSQSQGLIRLGPPHSFRPPVGTVPAPCHSSCRCLAHKAALLPSTPVPCRVHLFFFSFLPSGVFERLWFAPTTPPVPIPYRPGAPDDMTIWIIKPYRPPTMLNPCPSEGELGIMYCIMESVSMRAL